MPTILIGGYYGAGNIGDEAILAAMVDELRARHSDLTFIVTSWEPEKTAGDLLVEAVHWKDINGLLDAALRADLIILGGGGLFFDYWGLNPDTYLRKDSWDITAYGSLPLLAELLNLPCMIYAIGVGPLKTSLARQHTRLAFERSQVATLRDKESLELLAQTGFDFESRRGRIVEVLPDPVFSLSISSQDEESATVFLKGCGVDENAQLLGISLRYWDFGVALNEWLPCIANGLREFFNQNRQAKAILLPFQALGDSSHTNDVVVLEKLAGLINMPERIYLIPKIQTPYFAQALIKHCRVVLGMRLHSLVMGINAGTPVVGLPYDPKIKSILESVGLEDFCCASLTPEANVLSSKIQKAWDTSGEFRLNTRSLQEKLNRDAKKNAAFALDLLSRSQKNELQFPQQFMVQQARQLFQADTSLAQARQINQALAEQLSSSERSAQNFSARLAEIEGSSFWKIAKLYYRLMRETPAKYLYYFYVTWKYEGLRGVLSKSVKRMKTALSVAPGSAFKKKKKILASPEAIEAAEAVKEALSGRTLNGIAIITSAFVFNELYNQRVINLSKYLAGRGWGVVYVAWRWSKSEDMLSIGKEVYKNIFQVPVDMFLENLEAYSSINSGQKYFITEFPHPHFLPAALKLRRSGFKLVYEIIDEWEEFHKVGQASWFNKAVENAFVVNANFLTAVSQPLIEKFSGLRRDIHLSPNGYTPSLLGEKHRGISLKKRMNQGEFHLGYFGHLTESWFDWDFLLKVLDLAGEQNLKLYIHLIGYGEPNIKAKIEKYSKQVKFYGKVHPSKLYEYVTSWDAAMICFKSGKLSEAVDPIKIYEYLYFGLPVIVKGISHLKTFPLTQVVVDEKQAVDALVSLQAGGRRLSAQDSTARERVLAASIWEQRFTDLLEIMENEKWMFL